MTPSVPSLYGSRADHRSFIDQDSISSGQTQYNSTTISSSKFATKPYLCVQPGCLQTFARYYDLQRHMEIHFPPMRFDCPYARSGACGRAGEKTDTNKGGFTREDHYLDHLRGVHGGYIPQERRRSAGEREMAEKALLREQMKSGWDEPVVDSVKNTQLQHPQPMARRSIPMENKRKSANIIVTASCPSKS